MRVLLLPALASFAASCSGGSGGTDAGVDPGGPAFIIESPAAGSIVGGTVWFSVAPSDRDDVRSVAFAAGAVDLGSDTTAADGFRVYLDAAAFPDGPLTLVATATGTDGGTTTHSIAVTNVPRPPSSATVGAQGAVLGTGEANGAISTLMIPPGAVEGAAVTFHARSKAEVKAATGVDYDALGVTFLGAQELTSSIAIEAPLAVSSGGFAPMVQPGHVVVQYAIQPDADGDGAGELVVVNTASAAPTGDVISDPVPLATEVPTAAVGAAALLAVPQVPSSGPPGTPIDFHVAGLNANATSGTCAEWICAGGSTQSVCGNPSGTTFTTVIPACPPGIARVTIRNLGSGRAVGPFLVTVTAGRPVPNPVGAVGGFLGGIGDFADNLPDTGDPAADDAKEGGAGRSRDARDTLDDAGDPGGEAGDALEDAAEIGDNPDLAPPPAPHPGLPCLTEDDVKFLRERRAAAYAQMRRLGGSEYWTSENPMVFDLEALGFQLAVILERYPRCEPDREPKPPCAPSPTTTGGITGMGALPAIIGGFACGNINPPPPPRGPSVKVAPAAFPQQSGSARGRFVIRIVSNGNQVQFTGSTDGAGYFFVPAVPAGQPFTAIAVDKLTGQTREAQDVGPAFPDSIRLFFDFADERGGGGALALDSTTSGTLERLQIFTFHGAAGQVVTTAALVDQPPGPNNLAQATVRILGPDGTFVNRGCYHGAAGPGYDFAAACPLRLQATGIHTVELTSSLVDPQAFTLGLARTDDPAPVAIVAPATIIPGAVEILGDWQYHRFSATRNDLMKLVLDQSASPLDLDVTVRRADPEREFFDPGSGTVVAASTGPNQQRMETPRFALPATGDYFIEVLANWPSGTRLAKDGFLGPYTVTFLAPATRSAALDSNVSSTLVAPTFDVLALAGAAGQLVNVAVANPDRMNLLVTLEAPGGSTENATGGGPLIQTDLFRLPDTGSYRLIVDPRPGSSGSYTLGVPTIAAPASLDVSALPAQVAGELGVIGERRYYRFAGTQGQVRNFVLGHASGTLTATLRLLRDDRSDFWTGSQLRGATTSATRRSAETGSFTLPDTGDYLLEVRPTGFDATATGTFEVTVTTPQ